jgi:fructokinase
MNRSSKDFGCIKTTPKKNWSNVNLVKIFREKFKVPVGFNTDVNSALIGEGSLETLLNIDRLLYITIGTGIGVGFLNKGQALFDDAHLECGHIILPKLDNDEFYSICPYHENCWEGLCSGSAIAERTNKPASQISEDDLVWSRIIEYTAIAIHNLTLSFSPQKVILGGSVRNMGTGENKKFIDLLNKKFKSYADQYNGHCFDKNFIMSPLRGDDSGIYGAFIMGKTAFNAGVDCSVITQTGKI